MPIRAKVFIGAFITTGIFSVFEAARHAACDDWLRFGCYLTIALIGSCFKVKLPGIDGTMSVNFLFLLISLVQLSLMETMVMAFGASLLQILWNKKTPTTVQAAFNFSMIATAVSIAYHVYHWVSLISTHIGPVALIIVGTVFFVANTAPVAMIIAMTEHKAIHKLWSECYFWSFPHYLLGAAVAGFLGLLARNAGWQKTLLVFPIGYFIYRSYRLYLERLEAEKKHVEDMASLHLRTIEALALAIEAKDHTTHDHLNRVRTYAVELGKKMELEHDQLEALRAASLLHDIGKLAVPEHIINKPGRLTPEEFEKMKIHPRVGAEILKRVSFPYPVVPIVEAHHEHWDGSGYPYGLKGEDIPMGARILAVADCLDALASDRQYRRALDLPSALEKVYSMAGTNFDPAVVEVLRANAEELEVTAHVQAEPMEEPNVSSALRVEKDAAPATGYEPPQQPRNEATFLSSIAAARQEAQTLFELSHELGNSLSLDETLSLLSVRLRKLVPYDSIAIYLKTDDRLVPQHVSGENFRLLSSLEIPVGQGISGWVAQNGSPILNGSPAVEWGKAEIPANTIQLHSAIAVPLSGLTGVMGVLTLYRADIDAFTRDHLRILLAISSKVALSIENALRYQQAESSAVTDYLTGLPNARSLFLHLDRELSRCKRESTSLAVMVCDLDGFKQVNDHYGHLEGNKVLKIFSQSLRGVCREYDYVARMGGDEFVLVVPGLRPDAAHDKAAKMNEFAGEAGYRVCGEHLLGVSTGVAFFPDDGSDAEQLLAAADHRMYAEKQVHHEDRAKLIPFPVRPEQTTTVN